MEMNAAMRAVVFDWWTSQAYRHKWAESTLYGLFFSGLLVWDWLGVDWHVLRAMLFLHIITGLFLFPVTVLPFWLSHRSLLAKTGKKTFIRTGRVIELLLATCALTGGYLILWGAPGDTLGWLMQNLHFYSSWLLAPVIFYHAFRWSVLNLKRYFFA